MKKTNATMLTAAMFAAAVNLVPGSADASSALLKTDPLIESNVQATTTEVMNTYTTVYGPPWMLRTTTVADDEDEPIRQSLKTQPAYGPPINYGTTTEPDEPYIVPVTTTVNPVTTMAPLYGPPWVFGTTTTATYDPYDVVPQPAYGPPMMMRGDLTNDGRVNAFDLVEAKRLLLNMDENELFEKFRAADFNRDDRFSMADIIGLNRFLLGDKEGYDEKIDDEGNPVVTTTTFDSDENEKTTTKTTSTTTFMPDDKRTTVTTEVFAPLYGPPWVFDK